MFHTRTEPFVFGQDKVCPLKNKYYRQMKNSIFMKILKMNTIDIILGLILVIAFYLGFKKGLLRVLASLIGLVAAVYCAIYFSDYVKVYIVQWFDWSEDLNRLASFLTTFFLVIFIFALAGRVLTKVADLAMMGLFNKLLGGAFNILKIVFLLSVIFMFVNSSENYSILTAEKRDASILYNPIAALAPAILPTIEKHIDEFDLEESLEFPMDKTSDTLQ